MKVHLDYFKTPLCMIVSTGKDYVLTSFKADVTCVKCRKIIDTKREDQ
jgi:hypothetical protein